MTKATEISIELKNRGKTAAVLCGSTAEVVDRAITRAMIIIAKGETSQAETSIREEISDNFILFENIKKRGWTDPNLPEDFSYSLAILAIIEEMEAKGIRKKPSKIEYMTKRIVEMRREALKSEKLQKERE